MTSLGHLFDPKSNSIGAMRLFAASAVIVGHAFVFGGYGEDPLKVLTHNQVATGRWPVDMFFVLSGFLLVRSFERSTLFDYARNRALRIFPGFWTCLLVSGFVLPLSFGIQPAWKYMIRSAPLLIGVEYLIPGLFAGNPHPEVNSALWTLPVEVWCYISIPAFAALGTLVRSRAWIIFGVLLIIFWAVILFDKGAISSPIRLAVFFYAGACLHIYRNSVPASVPLAAGAMVLLCGVTMLSPRILDVPGGLFYMAAPILLSYTVVIAGVALPFRKLNAKNDISYGVYIYGTLILQCLTALGLSAGRLPYAEYILLDFTLTLAAAAVSWFAIEKPALRLKSRAKSTSELRAVTPP